MSKSPCLSRVRAAALALAFAVAAVPSFQRDAAAKAPPSKPAVASAGRRNAVRSGQTNSNRDTKRDRNSAQTSAKPSNSKAQATKPKDAKESKTKDAKDARNERGSSPSRDEIPTPPAGDPNRERITRLQDALKDILSGRALGRTRVGMRVALVRGDRLLFARHPDGLMDPASNQKVLATATALLRLGADWTYRTELSSAEPDPEGVITGNLYVRGNGNPSLRAATVSGWAARLRARGITRIDGGVVADPRRLGDNGSGGDAHGDSAESGHPPLMVDRGVTLVRVHPGAAVGAPAMVLTHPASDAASDRGRSGFTIINRAVTKDGGRTRVTVQVTLAAGSLRIEVAGKIALNSAGVAFRRHVPHPALHAAVLLRAALLAEGIAVRDGASTGNAPPDAAFVEVHRSEPLSTVLRRINKNSDNDQAELVLQTVGAEARGGAATTEKGLVVLREVLTSLGLPSSSYVPKNGSGLGHGNRITPAAMSALLRALYFDPRFGPELLQSLSVGGVDGTTRNRFKGTLASHRVRSKTGTLNGKSCLSGLVGDGDDVVVFSMMMQGFRGRALHSVRASQVGAVNAMMRYVREGTGERIAWPTTFDETTVGTDVETGGEVHESATEGEEEGEAAHPDGVMAPSLDLGDTILPATEPPPPAPAPSALPRTR